MKDAKYELAPSLCELFNYCIVTKTIPDEFKEATVTPLFKNKGSILDKNNYRGISTLPPVGKIFEKLLATQITIYFNINKLFFNGQHGFRNNHSCETALHELISYLNEARNKKLIAALLFGQEYFTN